MKKRCIAMAAGGTAGHVFPAQALREILATKNDIIFFTDARGKRFFDNPSEYCKLPIHNIQGSILKRIFSLLCLGVSTLKTLFILYRHNVKLVIGFGGLTSFPMLYAAKILNIPMILHEQNAVIGKANKFFLSHAQFLATSFLHTIGTENARKVVHTGNPIRSIIFDAKRRRTRITNEIYITIIGGSQGATIFDNIIASAIRNLPPELQERITIFQQVRRENIDAVQNIYHTTKIRKHTISDFFKDIPQMMADSDLIISRAGASTLFEIEHLNIPSIVIPMARSADNHQLHNALEYAKNRTCKVITEQELSIESLQFALENILIDNEIDKMRNYNHKGNHAAQKLAIKINEIIISMRL